jgi:hypothetical protein
VIAYNPKQTVQKGPRIAHTPQLSAGRSSFLARLGPKMAGRACPLCPGISDINLLGYGESIVYLDAEVAYRALDLGVTQQQLDRA